MFGSLFDPDALLWRWMSALVDVLALSLLWAFASLPVVTIGAATAALYDASAKYVRTGRAGACRRFWEVFRRELRGALLPSLIWAAALWAAFLILGLFWRGLLLELDGASLAIAAYAILLVLPLGAACWAFPILSRFSSGPLALLRTAFQFSLAYLPRTLLIVPATVLAVAAGALFWFPILFLPCLTALFWSLFMEGAFGKFTPGTEEDSAPRENADP